MATHHVFPFLFARTYRPGRNATERDETRPTITTTARPRLISPTSAAVDLETARIGSELLGLPLFEQGENVARVLEDRTDDGAARYGTAVVQMPRRATKTTSTWAVILGRAMTRPGYRCVVTAQTGSIASRILLEHADLLLRNGKAVESREQSSAGERIVLFRSGGRERLEFPSGSRIWVVPPEAGAVRSASSDDVVIDEAGEFEGEKGAEFLTGVLPLMDTKGPLAQLIISGTPGKHRSGMFWDKLEEARAGTDDELGIVDYSASDDDDPESEDVWARVHPGPSSILPDGRALTPLKVLRKRRGQLGLPRFAREYLCLWPMDSSTGAINTKSWASSGLDVDPPALPEHFGLAFDVAPDGSTAALVAAWREDDGRARVVVVDYRPGVPWLIRYAHAVAAKYRVPVRYDAIGANHGPASAIKRQGKGVSVVGGNARDAMAAAQGLVSALADDELRHYRQQSLDEAAASAKWRTSESGRLFARAASGGDVVCIVAASLALYQYDSAPLPVRGRIRSSSRR